MAKPSIILALVTGAVLGGAVAVGIVLLSGFLFVAVGRSPVSGGWVLYDQPIAYGHGSLCQVRTYTFARTTTGNGLFDPAAWPFEKLTVENEYGVWRDPESPSSANAQAACYRFRDFDNLISSSEGIRAERAVDELAHAVREARTGNAPFKITCIDKRTPDETPVDCNGLALLRDTDLRHVLQVFSGDDFPFQEVTSPADRFSEDVLTLRTWPRKGECRYQSLFYVMARAKPLPSVDPELRSITILIDCVA